MQLTLTRAPMTPRDVRRRYSNGRVFEVVLRKGYKNNGIWAGVKQALAAHRAWNERRRPHQIERVHACQCAMRHTAGGRVHCRRGWRRARSDWEGKVADILRLSPGGGLALSLWIKRRENEHSCGQLVKCTYRKNAKAPEPSHRTALSSCSARAVPLPSYSDP